MVLKYSGSAKESHRQSGLLFLTSDYTVLFWVCLRKHSRAWEHLSEKKVIYVRQMKKKKNYQIWLGAAKTSVDPNYYTSEYNTRGASIDLYVLRNLLPITNDGCSSLLNVMEGYISHRKAASKRIISRLLFTISKNNWLQIWV